MTEQKIPQLHLAASGGSVMILIDQFLHDVGSAADAGRADIKGAFARSEALRLLRHPDLHG